MSDSFEDLMRKAMQIRLQSLQAPPPLPVNSPLLRAMLTRSSVKPFNIEQAFHRLKSKLELSDSLHDLVQQKHNAVRSYLENNGHKIETKLLGSIKKKTAIHPKKQDVLDIDVLVVLGDFTGWVTYGGVTPQDAMGSVHTILGTSDRYAPMRPYQDAPTVSLEQKNEIKFEFVPAYLDKIGFSPLGVKHWPAGRGFWIVKNGQWVLADYDYEADYISKANAGADEWLIPTIKMLKAIKRVHFPVMKSFHLEILAAVIVPAVVQIKKEANLPISYPVLIADFFRIASNNYLSFLKIPGSNSSNVEIAPTASYFIGKKFALISNYCQDLSSPTKTYTEKLKGWNMLFGSNLLSS